MDRFGLSLGTGPEAARIGLRLRFAGLFAYLLTRVRLTRIGVGAVAVVEDPLYKVKGG